jgi:hypothetical protein
VSELLGSHPLALVQAGSYIGRGFCTLKEYQNVYRTSRQRLLTFHLTQEQAPYKHMYATFEASMDKLKSSADEAAKDALELLSVLSMLGLSWLQLSIFKAAWRGACKVSKTAVGHDDLRNSDPSTWHVS